MEKYTCTLWPDKKTIEVDAHESLLEALKRNGHYIKSSCGGCASCGDCVIKIVSGEDQLSAQTNEELKLLGNVYHITKERLSCQTKLIGPATIDISEHNEKSHQVNRERKFQKTKLRKPKPISEQVEVVPQEEKPLKQSGYKKPKAFKYSKSDDDQSR